MKNNKKNKAFSLLIAVICFLVIGVVLFLIFRNIKNEIPKPGDSSAIAENSGTPDDDFIETSEPDTPTNREETPEPSQAEVPSGSAENEGTEASSGKDDSASQSTGSAVTESVKKDSGKQESEKTGTSKEETQKEESGKKESTKEETGKDKTSEQESGKDASDKDDSGEDDSRLPFSPSDTYETEIF